MKLSSVENPVDIPLYWLVNRDPYNGLLKSPYNWVGFHPLYQTTNQGFQHCSIGSMMDCKDILMPGIGMVKDKQYHMPGDSIRDLFQFRSWRSRFPSKGSLKHLKHPKKGTKNSQMNMFSSLFRGKSLFLHDDWMPSNRRRTIVSRGWGPLVGVNCETRFFEDSTRSCRPQEGPLPGIKWSYNPNKGRKINGHWGYNPTYNGYNSTYYKW